MELIRTTETAFILHGVLTPHVTPYLQRPKKNNGISNIMFI